MIAWFRVNNRLRWSGTIQAPWPPTAASALYRVVTMTRPPCFAVMKSSSIQAAMRDLAFGSEVGKPVTKLSDNDPS